MSRRRSIRYGDDRSDINISPMIDMVFILLIFFIVTTVFVDERGLETDKPTPNINPVQTEDKPFLIRVTANGGILHEGTDIGLGGVRSRVATRMRESKVPVIIEVQAQTRSGLMVRVMDEARLGGAEQLSVNHFN